LLFIGQSVCIDKAYESNPNVSGLSHNEIYAYLCYYLLRSNIKLWWKNSLD